LFLFLINYTIWRLKPYLSEYLYSVALFNFQFPSFPFAPGKTSFCIATSDKCFSRFLYPLGLLSQSLINCLLYALRHASLMALTTMHSICSVASLAIGPYLLVRLVWFLLLTELSRHPILSAIFLACDKRLTIYIHPGPCRNLKDLSFR
jgi:hypothetical protein